MCIDRFWLMNPPQKGEDINACIVHSQHVILKCEDKICRVYPYLVFFATSPYHFFRRIPPLELGLNGLRNNTPVSCRYTLEDEVDYASALLSVKSREYIVVVPRLKVDKLMPFSGYQWAEQCSWVRVTGHTLVGGVDHPWRDYA